jgi:GNAT superfamily N-acetyltransferase
MAQITLQAVESSEQRESACVLIAEYLHWVAGVARSTHGLSFDVDAMVRSDIDDTSKFYPPAGRLYLVCRDDQPVGVGALKRLSADVGEVQRMYVQPHARGLGGARVLVERLIQDAREMGFSRLRLESLKALSAAHSLYHSVGFVDIEPYADNSMRDYQAAEALQAYRQSAVFMELTLDGPRS